MSSKRSHEGYLMIDHRSGVGLPDEVVRAEGLPEGAGRGLFETATYTCNHCKTIVVMNPQRTRERAWCRGCDHYICDACEVHRKLAGGCRTFDEVVDKALEAAEKQADQPAPSIVLLS